MVKDFWGRDITNDINSLLDHFFKIAYGYGNFDDDIDETTDAILKIVRRSTEEWQVVRTLRMMEIILGGTDPRTCHLKKKVKARQVIIEIRSRFPLLYESFDHEYSCPEVNLYESEAEFEERLRMEQIRLYEEFAREIDPIVRSVLAHCLHDPYVQTTKYKGCLPAWRTGKITIVLGQLPMSWNLKIRPPLFVYGTGDSRLCTLLRERTGLDVIVPKDDSLTMT